MQSKIYKGIIIGAIIIIIAHLILIDYSSLNLSKNAGSYLGIISMVCVIAAGILSNNKNRNKVTNE